jgi:hypothetical protein
MAGGTLFRRKDVGPSFQKLLHAVILYIDWGWGAAQWWSAFLACVGPTGRGGDDGNKTKFLLARGHLICLWQSRVVSIENVWSTKPEIFVSLLETFANSWCC